ncbi:MAG TPA: carbohydrate porin [Gammaproteobacteria bacterium]|nr:carbohydrate porin [Gammaproteobacteria bacterium]
MRKICWLFVLLMGATAFVAQAYADTPPGVTTISGTSFMDFTDLTQDLNGNATSSQGYGIDVKRFYFIVDHGFDDIWSVNLTTDFNYTKATGETQLFVKKAYVQAKLSEAAGFRLGSADMPWIPFDESIYGYRFVEPTLIDRLHFGNSADWGVHFFGRSDNNFASYAVSAVEGGGYRNPTRSKAMDFEGRVAIEPAEGLIIAVGGYSGELGQDTAATPALNTATRADALIAYKVSWLTLGAEYFHASNFTPTAVTTVKTDAASGYSLYGSVQISENGTALFARYDHADPSKSQDPSQQDKYYNFGVSFPANKNITWAVAYKHESLADNVNSLTTREIGVWAQIKF